MKRILALAGHELRFGKPGPEDGIVVWGASPTAWRGERMAAKTGRPLVRLEDAFIRSIRPGRMGDAPIGLLIDAEGIHFDSSDPSRIERILATDPLDNSHILARAKTGIERIRALELSKYNLHDLSRPAPAPGYVLVVDQTLGDASVTASGADRGSFEEMLEVARRDWPHAKILIRSHPESANGLRQGHYGPEHLRDPDGPGISFSDPAIPPYALLEGAVAVYTVSSQLGFEAILAGHRPRVWGLPFYAGWGLTEDRTPPSRRKRKLTRAQLFAGVMILAPLWYDPCRDRLCSFEEALDQMEAELRAFRQDRHGHAAYGMRLWKRARLQAFFGAQKPLRFIRDPAAAKGQSLLIWAGQQPEALSTPALRVEDGFLRSRGLGAELVPPLSLVADDLGIYYDPSQPSRLEALITAPLPPGGHARATRLIERLLAANLTKYNIDGAIPALPSRETDQRSRILVPGQVEDDASILKGAGAVRTNLALLQETRAQNPDALILYKPHPDVEAGLRPGALPRQQAADYADLVLDRTSIAAALNEVDEVWTMTSLTGFEALIRGKRVTTFGAPFYAGWGLTHDLGEIPKRRLRGPDGALLPRPDLAQLVHASLIAYPRYWDPVSRRPCPVEVALDRLASGEIPHPGRLNRLISKLQGRFASHARLWRK
ncbi:capsular polysaccharide biosynthesis protein [Xinfangfangia sp. D13-10-4-6]|nr:capsular polysaccharide biosynthesis protein [Pseudogemmobacter hezensis]